VKDVDWGRNNRCANSARKPHAGACGLSQERTSGRGADTSQNVGSGFTASESMARWRPTVQRTWHVPGQGFKIPIELETSSSAD
jgi:hypothetical protein